MGSSIRVTISDHRRGLHSLHLVHQKDVAVSAMVYRLGQVARPKCSAMMPVGHRLVGVWWGINAWYQMESGYQMK